MGTHRIMNASFIACSRRFYCFEFCFVLFLFFPQPTEYGAEGFVLRRCPDVGVGRGTPGGPSLVTDHMGNPVYAHDASKWEQLVTHFAASGVEGGE